jgi:hypothetical protein
MTEPLRCPKPNCESLNVESVEGNRYKCLDCGEGFDAPRQAKRRGLSGLGERNKARRSNRGRRS